MFPDALTRKVEDINQVVEIGIGNRTAFARALTASGIQVTVTDIRPIDPPADVRFVQDDIVDPDLAIYADADLLYARRLPEELQSPAAALARTVETPFAFTTLGFEHPTIPVDIIGDATVAWYLAR